MADSAVSRIVRSIRKKRGWTQERLAHEMGVSFSTINTWERGKRTPHPFLLRRLEEMMGQISDDEQDETHGK